MDKYLGQTINKINDDFDFVVTEIQRYVRQPAISSTGEGMEESYKLTREICEYFKVDAWKEYEVGGWPYVYARFNAKNPNAKTMVAYCSMDMVPVSPEKWVVPPHNAEIRNPSILNLPDHLGKIMIGRSTADKHGPFLCFLFALKFMRDVTGDIPFNIHLLLDFQEEIGSPTWRKFVNEVENTILDGDFAWMPMFLQNTNSVFELFCGYKGMLAFELACRGGEWGGTRDGRDLWSPHWQLYDSPVHKLLQAINSLWDNDGDIAVEGINELVITLPEDIRHWDTIRANINPEKILQDMNIRRFRGGKDGKELFTGFYRDPILNLDGFSAGYTGDNFSTMMPQAAKAKFDFRSVPNITVDKFFELLRSHLNKSGFDMVEIKPVGTGWDAGKTSPEHPIVKATASATEQMGAKYQIFPMCMAADPLGSLCNPPFNLPMVFGGLGIMMNVHMTNECITIRGIRDNIEHTIRIFNEIAKLDEIPKNRLT